MTGWPIFAGMALFGFAVFACCQWWYWHNEYEQLRQYFVQTMKDANSPFIRPLPLDEYGATEGAKPYGKVGSRFTHLDNVIPFERRK
jgi:hypothetical protein